jgi:hypothetical protein
MGGSGRLNERIQLVLQKKIHFLDDHGATISVSDGLNYISKYKPKQSESMARLLDSAVA